MRRDLGRHQGADALPGRPAVRPENGGDINRGQLKTRTSRILGIALDASDDGQDEESLLEELANEAVIDLLSRTRLHVRLAEIGLAEGSTEFEIDDYILRLHEMTRGGVTLTEQDTNDLGQNDFAVSGYNRIVFGQPGGESEEILAYYTPLPTPMTADAHDPSEQTYGRVPSVFHPALITYMCWHSADKAGDMQAGRGEMYRTRYEGQDGNGGPGSWLGRVKTATNQRARMTRVTRSRPALLSDQYAQYWQG